MDPSFSIGILVLEKDLIGCIVAKERFGCSTIFVILLQPLS
jgi:hypothetical protein